MKRLTLILDLLFLFCAQPFLAAQELSYRIINKQHGLPTSTIYDLLQDEKGYIWLGTDKGLFRYDGINFQDFYSYKQTGKSLSNLNLDKYGRVWCQNFVGEVFYTSGDSLYREELLDITGAFFPAKILHENILAMFEKERIKLLNLESRIIKIVPLKKQYYAPFASNGAKSFSILADNEAAQFVTVESDGKLLECTLNKCGKETLYFHVKSGEYTFMLPKYDAKFVYIYHGVNCVGSVKLPFSCIVQNFHLVNPTLLAICTPSGVFFLEKKKTVWEVLDNTLFLDGVNVSSVLQDREGNFWFGTINNGLIFVSSLSNRLMMRDIFITKLHNYVFAKSITAGTSGNEIYEIKLSEKTAKLVEKRSTNMEVVAVGSDPETGKLLYCSDKLYLFGDKNFSINNAVKDIKNFGKNRFLLSSTGHVSMLKIDSGKILSEYVLENGLRNRGILTFPDKKNFYLATSKGIVKYDNGKLTEIKHRDRPILAENFVVSGDSIFFGGVKGIMCLKNDEVILHLTKKDGLADNAVYRLNCHNQKLWWISESCVQSYDLLNKQIHTYDRSSGLPDAEYKDLLPYNDTLFVATSKGLAFFPTDVLEKRPTYSPNIEAWVITSEKKFTPDEFFSLPYDKNDLQIEFSVLMFRGAEQMKIAYKINDAHWINLENNTRQINLSSLSPGKYDLTIRAYLQSGNQLHFTKNISFEVKKPFWLTYWAVALYILLFFSAAFAFFKYRIKRLEEKSKADAQKIYLEQQLQKSLLTSIKAQMNPHFIFNALNTIQSYIYLNEKQQASTYLVKFSELTRMILEMSNYETISLADEIKTLKLYLELEAMRFEDTLIFEINVAENIKTEMCKIPSMLIQPYVENAVKHGLLHKKDDRRVSVDFFIEDNLLNVVIDDNGIGREKSKQINDARKNKPQSFATIANQKRLELLNLGLNVNIGIEIIDKYDEQNMPSGTKVILKIPLKTT